MNKGKIVAEEDIGKLSKLLKSKQKLRLRIEGPADDIIKSLSDLEDLSEVIYQEPYHVIVFEDGKKPQSKINKVISEEGWDLLLMENMEMSLEEIFIKLTRDMEN